MKNFLTIICLIAFSIDMADAQTSIILNDKVTFESSSDLNFLLDAHYDKNKYCDLMQGYRIQIMNSSNREDVYKKKGPNEPPQKKIYYEIPPRGIITPKKVLRTLLPILVLRTLLLILVLRTLLLVPMAQMIRSHA